MTQPKLKPEIKDQWIAALESGDYQQGQGFLTVIEPDGTEKNCCLGVLCDLAMKAGVPLESSTSERQLYDRNLAATREVTTRDYQDEQDFAEAWSLPTQVARWAFGQPANPADLYDDAYTSPHAGDQPLATHNDGDEGVSAKNFSQIADLIREHL